MFMIQDIKSPPASPDLISKRNIRQVMEETFQSVVGGRGSGITADITEKNKEHVPDVENNV